MNQHLTWDDLSRNALTVERMRQWRDSLEERFTLLAESQSEDAVELLDGLADELAAFRFCLEALYTTGRR